jgi:uncharacterized protein
MIDLRAVLDTNIILAAFRSRHERSPNREVLLRWEDHQFLMLYSPDTLLEYIEKLSQHGIASLQITRFIARLSLLAEKVHIGSFHLRHYPVDSDDTAFLLCALNGSASHLVTYDHHLLNLRFSYRQQVEICELQLFLGLCRAKAGK